MMNQVFNTLPDDRPITAVQVVEDPDKCPPGYTVVSRTHDQDSDADLWRDASFFAKKTTRYICISKVPDNSNNCVVEAVSVLNEKDCPTEGFSVITRTSDTDQKAWRRKQLCYRLCKRDRITTAVTDIIILCKMKKAPKGFSLAGEINGVTICYKRGSCRNEIEPVNRLLSDLSVSPSTPKPKWNSKKPVRPPPPTPTYANGMYPGIPQHNGSDSSLSLYPSRPAPKPPAPSNYATLAAYSELEGVPFVINPRYQQLYNSPSVIQYPVIKLKTWEEIEKSIIMTLVLNARRKYTELDKPSHKKVTLWKVRTADN